MFDLNSLVRTNIRSLQPYTSARDEYSDREGVFLDANENPFGELNRYPDPYQKVLKEKLSKQKSIPKTQIFIGNGSDEVIDLAYRIFCEPGRDKALILVPTYGMYAVSAAINDIELLEVPLSEDFQPELGLLEEAFKDKAIKLLFLCSPNNPTGNSFSKSSIEKILNQFNGIVIIDEAYIDFSDKQSWLKSLEDYPNLIVMQTFSKSWGLAAARLGVAYASEAIINLFNKVKPPYNVSQPNQQAAIKALSKSSEVESKIKVILEQRLALENKLNELNLVRKIHPSDANFLLVEVDNANSVYQKLIDQQVIVRNRNSLIRNCLRITVGTEAENQTLIKALKDLEI